jgi:3-hydroxyacyl-CoA dehydrogenase
VSYSHWNEAKKVCVIGAGTMGSGIAAHLANIGFSVTLLDLTQESVEAAFGRAKAAKPPHFFVPGNADRIRLGSIEKNLHWAADADWVCEAIIEKMDAKRALFAQLDEILPERTAITTNTSGLEIELLAEGRSQAFRRRFLGTHFFNPPRYLKLLELIPTAGTDPEAISAMTGFLEEKVARRVVLAKDTPGFIANRFGMWAMFKAIHVAEKLGLTIEQVDAITGPFLGRPRSASFRLNDIVGLDIMLDIARNLYERCPNDPYRDSLATPESMLALMERGWIGEKAGQGYYRREGKEFMAFDFHTKAYRMRQEASFAVIDENAKKPLGERVALALDGKDEVGEFLRHYLVPTLQYANYLKEEISHNVLDFDRVMMWGFGWETGPFAMMDAIGTERFGVEKRFFEGATLRSFEGAYVAIPEEPQYRSIRDYPILEKHENFNLRDLGDGVKAVSLTTKMGTINPLLVTELTAFLENHSGPTVLASEARHFSLGFDLNWFLARIEAEEWEAIDEALYRLQMLAVKLSERPFVAAVHGYCLGAGMELAFQCPQVAVLCDAMLGFPEAKVGLFPGGGGTAELALRSRQAGAKAALQSAIHLIQGESSQNADHARVLGYLRSSDVTVYHPERLLTEARTLAVNLQIAQRTEWKTIEGPLHGMIDRAQEDLKNKDQLTDHDLQIGDRVKAIYAKSTSFENALGHERQLFVELCKMGLTHARIRHMLETGKPLRN